MSKTSGARRLYVTFAVLSAISLLLAELLMRPGDALTPVRGSPPFELDQPPAGAANSPAVPAP